MHYLIDGHNLIARIYDIDLSDPDDEVKLILRLKSWAAANPRRKATLYFDGGLPGGVAHRLSSSSIKVIFAPERKTADSLIIKRIRAIKNPPEYILVSSDQKIIDAAQKRRLRHIRAETFAGQIDEDRDKRQMPPPHENNDDPPINADEVAEWLELFGSEPDIPAKAKKPARRPRTAPSPRKRRRRRSPQTLKRSDHGLDDDELAEWLDLFGQD